MIIHRLTHWLIWAPTQSWRATQPQTDFNLLVWESRPPRVPAFKLKYSYAKGIDTGRRRHWWLSMCCRNILRHTGGQPANISKTHDSQGQNEEDRGIWMVTVGGAADNCGKRCPSLSSNICTVNRASRCTKHLWANLPQIHDASYHMVTFNKDLFNLQSLIRDAAHLMVELKTSTLFASSPRSHFPSQTLI